MPVLTDDVLAVHERFAGMSYDELKAVTALDNEVALPAGATKAAVIGDENGPDAGVHVLALPHQQAWKPSMALRSHMYHAINNPDGLTIVLPNNSVSNRYYQYDGTDRLDIVNGEMDVHYDRQLTTVEGILERFGAYVGPVALKGYSLGGLTALGMAAAGSDRLNVTEVHSFEAPNQETTPKALRKAFMKSGTLGDQRGAIEDAHIPALEQALRFDRLMLDYARFGVASVVNAGNKALAAGMAEPGYEQLVRRALSQHDRARIYAGHVIGSRLFSPEVVAGINDPRFIVRSIAEGDGNRRHATGDNPVAHALILHR